MKKKSVQNSFLVSNSFKTLSQFFTTPLEKGDILHSQINSKYLFCFLLSITFIPHFKLLNLRNEITYKNCFCIISNNKTSLKNFVYLLRLLESMHIRMYIYVCVSDDIFLVSSCMHLETMLFQRHFFVIFSYFN